MVDTNNTDERLPAMTWDDELETLVTKAYEQFSESDVQRVISQALAEAVSAGESPLHESLTAEAAEAAGTEANIDLPGDFRTT